MICSPNQEWRTQAELVAARGRPMLLIGSCDDDANFVQTLVERYSLTARMDRTGRRYLIWPPQFSA